MIGPIVRLKGAQMLVSIHTVDTDETNEIMMRRNMVLLILKLVVAFIALGALVVNLPFMHPLLVCLEAAWCLESLGTAVARKFWRIFGVGDPVLLVVRGGDSLGADGTLSSRQLILLRWHIRECDKGAFTIWLRQIILLYRFLLTLRRPCLCTGVHTLFRELFSEENFHATSWDFL